MTDEAFPFKDFPPIQSDGSIDYPTFVTYRGYTREMALRSVGEGWAVFP